MITPVLLCGGSGTRLWPLSRQSYPKQFSPLVGDETLFQAAARRFAGPGFAAPLVVTGAGFRFIVTDELAEIGLAPGAVLIEPEGRNTAPAVLAAALWLAEREARADDLMLITPSDHAIADTAGFRAAIEAGEAAARAGQLVTFGIHPTRAETGYGWLEPAVPLPATPTAVPLTRFVEKPDAATAQVLFEGGRHLWNAGIFLFSARAIIAAFEAHAPGLVAPVRAALTGGCPDLDFFRLAGEPWNEIEPVSLDHAVMEHAGAVSAVPYSGAWSDLGDWAAVARESVSDSAGVATFGQATAIECRDTFLRSEDEGLTLVGLGLEGVVAIAMPDAVLVADATRTQEVGRAVAALKAKAVPQATSFQRDHRPWGWFESLATGERFQVKRIVVKPGAMLSLQSHVHRAEHWIVVEGTARVTIGTRVSLVSENQSVYVPLGEVHRLENPGKVPLVLIEVQTGSYLGEDDIERHDDIYARTPNE